MSDQSPYTSSSNNVVRFPEMKVGQGTMLGSGLKGGGGDGTYDDMEPRVAALEKGFERIEKKLDTLISDVAETKGQLKAMPSAATFGDLRAAIGKLEGRVERLPTMAKLGTLTVLLGAIIKAPELVAFIKSWIGV